MIYEETKKSTNVDAVVSWNSPLSNSVDDTILAVEVMGIYVEDDESKKFPQMAMVAVHKNIVSSTTQTPLITSNLFANSEKKILKSLDRGLDNFSAGKITGFKANEATPPSTWQSISRNEVDDEFDISIAKGVDVQKSPIIDVIPEKVQENPVMDVIPRNEEFAIETAKAVAAQRQKEKEEMQKHKEDAAQKQKRKEEMQKQKEDAAKDATKDTTPKTVSNNIDGDYAVEAAKNIIKRKTLGNIDGDYAVEAAKNAMKIKGIKRKERPKKKEVYTEEPEEKVRPNVPLQGSKIDMASYMEPQPPKLHGPSWSISSPKTRKARLKKKNKIKRKSIPSEHVAEFVRDLKPSKEAHGTDSVKSKAKNEIEAEVIRDLKSSSNMLGKDSKTNPVVEAEIIQSSKTKDDSSQLKNEKSSNMKKNLNIRVVDNKNDHVSSTINSDTVDIDEKKDDPEEVKRAKAAQRVMEEIAEQSQDMTSEELLESILKFGEEKKKEEAVGTGFVSGAFEKAKELLREQKQKREVRLKEASKIDFKLDIADVKESPTNEPESPEEELKRIFRAGEQFAEKQIELHTTGKGLTKEQNDKVDELVRGEKSISSHARTLDEELAELEVRVNRNPAEEMDGPPRNAMFDIMSGPEVYNPNVDPETSVNWPGALPGTKTVRLPAELSEAVKQAKFAADVITKIREEHIQGENNDEDTIKYYVGDRELTRQEVQNLRIVVQEGVELGIINDPLLLMEEQSRLQIVLDELWNQPEERFKEIADNYRDLLLSENFVAILKERLTAMANRDLNAKRQVNEDEQKKLSKQHEREREILGKLIVHTQLLLKEVSALGATLEAQQVEVIRSICKVAMDPIYKTEEETARALTDAVHDMRPMFDETFVAYIKYAVAEEEGRLARAGVLDDPDHCQWLMVLKVMQQGVYSEIAKGINRYIEHIWYVLRMETPGQRRALLSEFIDALPTLDVRPFVQVVDNMASSLGDAVKGDIEPIVLGEMTNKLLQLHQDTHDLLPKERIDEMAKDADEWAAKQKQRLLEQRAIVKKRMEEQDKHLTSGVLKRAADTEKFN